MAEDRHQNISFIFMMKQGLPKPLADVGGCGCTLEIHGGKFVEGVLIQVIVVIFEKVLLHGELVNVNLLSNNSSLKILTADRDML